MRPECPGGSFSPTSAPAAEDEYLVRFWSRQTPDFRGSSAGSRQFGTYANYIFPDQLLFVKTRTKNLAFLFICVQAAHRIRMTNCPLTGIKGKRRAKSAENSSNFRHKLTSESQRKNPRMTGGFVAAGVPGLEPRTNDSDLGRATHLQLGRNSADFRGFHASSVRVGTDDYGPILVTQWGIWFISGQSSEAVQGTETRSRRSATRSRSV
jgi:hypothetical protein